MKKLLLILLLCLPISIFAKVSIDKDNCTITKDGKTFPLYGKVKIVESFPDIKVKIVDSFADIKVTIVDSFADECGKVKIVDSFPTIKVQLVNSFPDITVKIVDSFPGIK
ncbi:MAG TPA: hypothetical protein PK638_02520 [Candidatus Enterocola sp.]|jgi:hypothetical protein|nr:hypothetical protein [Candidatus Enterocola sp.]HPG55677.1 hypothetical protein [Candidatus Enterocola sp.]